MFGHWNREQEFYNDFLYNDVNGKFSELDEADQKKVGALIAASYEASEAAAAVLKGLAPPSTTRPNPDISY